MTEKCGLNGCDNPVRRSIEFGDIRGVTLELCSECADRMMERSANYP